MSEITGTVKSYTAPRGNGPATFSILGDDGAMLPVKCFPTEYATGLANPAHELLTELARSQGRARLELSEVSRIRTDGKPDAYWRVDAAERLANGSAPPAASPLPMAVPPAAGGAPLAVTLREQLAGDATGQRIVASFAISSAIAIGARSEAEVLDLARMVLRTLEQLTAELRA